jgi:hypothetical protein
MEIERAGGNVDQADRRKLSEQFLEAPRGRWAKVDSVYDGHRAGVGRLPDSVAAVDDVQESLRSLQKMIGQGFSEQWLRNRLTMRRLERMEQQQVLLAADPHQAALPAYGRGMVAEQRSLTSAPGGS